MRGARAYSIVSKFVISDYITLAIYSIKRFFLMYLVPTDLFVSNYEKSDVPELDSEKCKENNLHHFLKWENLQSNLTGVGLGLISKTTKLVLNIFQI